MKELNVLKFYGILLVVLGHVAFVYSPLSIITPHTPSLTINFVKDVIYSFHMPLFFFASGCIFSYQLEVKRKPMTFAQLLRNKTKRLMIPFYAFALLMVYPTMVLLGFRDPVHYFFDGFILAIDPRHLWFVMALFLIFLLFFGLRKVCNRIHLPIWTLSILALLIYIFPINIAYFQIRNVEEYLIWFTLGYLFTIYKSAFKYVVIVALCGLGFNMTLPETTPPNMLKLFNGILWIAVFYVLSIYTIKIESAKLYQWVAPNSFGIYLFHAMIIYWIEFIAAPYPINPYPLSVAAVVISLTLSILLTVMVRKLGLGIIIGEKTK